MLLCWYLFSIIIVIEINCSSSETCSLAFFLSDTRFASNSQKVMCRKINTIDLASASSRPDVSLEIGC
jgi:hypothetical protein